jgi:hypothetical protein
MKALVLCGVILGLMNEANACIWLTGTKYQGGSIKILGHSGAQLIRSSIKYDPAPDGTQMEAALRGSTNYNERSDYTVALMYLGRASEAIPLLQQLEKEKTGEYFIAANLGTAYELAAQSEEALRWIKEGIQRNPDSHEGTEWLHVKILEAKIAAKQDPNYFKQHSVLELEPEKLKEEIQIGDKKLTQKELTDAIQHQLVERLHFVKPPDAAVASLLFDYGAIEARFKTLESAKEVLQMAIEYGYPKEKIAPLVTLYDQHIASRKTESFVGWALTGLVVVGIVLGLLKGISLLLSRFDPRRTK